MRQSVVVTLIIMGSLLVMAPLITGAFVVCAVAQAVAQAGREVSANAPGQDSSYLWVCLGAGVILIGIGVAGEYLSGRRPAPTQRLSETAPVVKVSA